ncbi:MAG: transcriptional regulator NrdR [Coriobacteriales bacterium]|jgi:transcriptional repressor NrdR|nr:transcriptional regulator NrdR [Coriobacteriales bacterium]
MRCVSCGYPESKVIDSRPSEDGVSVRRRRECLECGARFTTYERHNEVPLVVVKNDRSCEPFDRNKLLHGLFIATAKRDVPVAKLEALIDDVEAEIRNTLKSEVRSKVLGDMVLERLRALDDVAYIRFASVYKDFKDVDEFQAALKGMG